MSTFTKLKLTITKGISHSLRKITKRDECNCSVDKKYIRRIKRTRVQKIARVSAFYQCKACLGSIVVKAA